ncbi:uncharacterized protein C2845_PM15G05780 [Panicum miliaceum]|uniref:Uncharacterized protein n=1 Tax=Panicum miliaceum TaxID=4540 RepID=A0A3L6Q5L6_PANMI|nr:uncharacterized protein C2845_PM15G05780 [Panicum miliaceum]
MSTPRGHTRAVPGHRRSLEADLGCSPLRERNLHNHNLGPIGYDGKLAQWEREDSHLTAQGIPNPWDEFSAGRPRNWLRGRSELHESEGTASIRWKNESTKEMSKVIKDKLEAA